MSFENDDHYKTLRKAYDSGLIGKRDFPTFESFLESEMAIAESQNKLIQEKKKNRQDAKAFKINMDKSRDNISIQDLEEVGGKFYKKSDGNLFTGKVYGKVAGRISNGNKLGEWIEYYDDGTQFIVERFKNGKLSGLREIFDENGIEIEKLQYKNNKANGSYTRYHTLSEQVKEVGQYLSGLPHGEFRLFYSDGLISEKRNYLQGKRHGKYTAWNSVWKSKQCYYKNGKLDGKFETFRDFEKPEIVAKYKIGKLTGEYIEYDSNQKVKVKCFYRNGNLHGKYEQNDHTGQEESVYKNGKLLSKKFQPVKKESALKEVIGGIFAALLIIYIAVFVL